MRYLNLWQTELPPVLPMSGPINGAAQRMRDASQATKPGCESPKEDGCKQGTREMPFDASRLPAAAPPEPTPADPVWVPWSGGECPVHPGARVWCRFTSGVVEAAHAIQFYWGNHSSRSFDIIAYRLANPTPRGPCVLPADHVHAEAERLWRSDDTLKVWVFLLAVGCWLLLDYPDWSGSRYHVGHVSPEAA